MEQQAKVENIFHLKVGLYSSETLVEVNQAIIAWSFRHQIILIIMISHERSTNWY